MTNNKKQSPIAVVGLSAILPGSHYDAFFWQDIVNGVDHVTEVPDSHWLVSDYYNESLSAADKTYSKRGAFLSPTPFNPLEFGIPPSAIPSTDTAQLLALIAAKRILSEVSPDKKNSIDRDKISVILGMTSTTELVTQMSNRLQRPIWVKSMRECGLLESDIDAICERIEQHYVPWQESTFPGLLGNVVAGRIANRLDTGGSNFVTDAACASSLAAISAGINELELGYSDLVVSGGVDAMNDILMYLCFSKTPALSLTGDCRPFSDAADGTILGEGIVMFGLRRLEDAERDNMPIYAVIRGLGSASDGKGTSVYAPHPQGQAKALRRAYDRAGYQPDTVELVEAHGTGTKAGDLAEFSALSMVFKEQGTVKTGWCALGSIKSQVGHTKAAAGAAGLLKAVLSLHHKVLPPTLKVSQPNPKFDINASPFYINTHAKPWIRSSDHPRRAAVSSFGFGGSNFHLTLEEYVGKTRPAGKIRVFPTELMLLSARSRQDLLEQVNALKQPQDKLNLERSAKMSQQAFDSNHAYRLSIVVESWQQLEEQIHLIVDSIESHTRHCIIVKDRFSYQAEAVATEKIAFLFPGQGSQYLYMGDQLAMAFDQTRSIWDQAASELHSTPPLHEIVFPASSFSDQEQLQNSDKLSAMAWAQPAIGAVSLAQLEVLTAFDLQADMVGGHSFGEVISLSVAGVYDGQTALKIACKRGELMTQAATTAGAMTAISMTIDEVTKLLQESHCDLVIANHNSPNQVVVSGRLQEIENFEINLKAKNIPFSRLPVASAFHSPIIASSCEPFLAFLQKLPIKAPSIPVFSNSTAKPYPDTVEAIPRQLASQLTKSVRFVEQIDAMYESGARVFVEVGPSNVLTGLVHKCLGEQQHFAINLDKRGEHGVTALLKAVGQLSVAGVKLDYGLLWEQFRPCPIDQDQPHSIAITGSNYGKPYPPAGGVDVLPEPNEMPVERAEIVNSVQPNRDNLDKVNDPLPGVENIVQGSSQSIPTPPYQQPTPVSNEQGKDYKDTKAATYYAFQKHTAEAHVAFQKSMSDSHQAFLQLAEKTLLSLHTDQLANSNESTESGLSRPQQYTNNGDFLADYAQENKQSFDEPVTTQSTQSLTSSDSEQQPDKVLGAAPQSEEIQTSVEPIVNIESILLAVISEKTGYPQEMLTGDMELEAGLGIDSIKRVEIFSALQDKFTDLPEIDPAKMATLQTLGQIIDFIEQETKVTGIHNARKKESNESAATAIDPKLVVLNIIAEKTGYPVEMLTDDMELEAGLGIDSIKRVEIFSALQDKYHDLPEIDPTQMSTLQTLAQIIDFIEKKTTGNRVHPKVHLEANENDAITINPRQVVMDIIAEKTGYPVEMLTDDMELETGLGIDSIKRVEIFSALQDKVTDLPEVDPADMAKLATLGQIVQFIDHNPLIANPSSSVVNSAPALAVVNPNLQRLILKIVDSPASGISMAGLKGANRISIIADQLGVAAVLANKLCDYGLNAQVQKSIRDDAEVIIFLAALTKEHSDKDILAIHQQAFLAANAVAKRLESSAGVFITIQDTGGSFALDSSSAKTDWLSGFPGLVKTAAIEWPKTAVKAIDIACSGRSKEQLADTIFKELLEGGPEIEVGFPADGRRITLSSISAPLAIADQVAINSDSIWVVSGGARGVTAACIETIARNYQPKFVLLGRTALIDEAQETQSLVNEIDIRRWLLQQAKESGNNIPTPKQINQKINAILSCREVKENLRRIEQLGSQVRYFNADVCNPDEVNQILNSVRTEWGPITGLIHGAGVLSDKRIADKNIEQFDRVFSTKVNGLKVLLEQTKADPLNIICLFSSVAARRGNIGQCDYAMANEVLNKVAQSEARRRRKTCLVKSINWGPWDGGMVSTSLKSHFENQGISLIPLEAGARFFDLELSNTSDQQVEVVVGAEQSAFPRLGIAAIDNKMEIEITSSMISHYQDHAINGIPVLPMTQVIEWFLRVAKSKQPGIENITLTDIVVLKGILFDSSNASSNYRYQIICENESGMTSNFIKIQLLSLDGTPHYQAKFELSDQPDKSRNVIAQSAKSHSWPYSAKSGYQEKLFHGPQFQVIQQLETISDQGGTALLDSQLGAIWPDEARSISNPVLLDGGLQLLLLWAFEKTGKTSLPTAIGECKCFGSTPIKGTVACHFSSRIDGQFRTVSDLIFTDSNARVLVELRGVEMHLLNETNEIETAIKDRV